MFIKLVCDCEFWLERSVWKFNASMYVLLDTMPCANIHIYLSNYQYWLMWCLAKTFFKIFVDFGFFFKKNFFLERVILVFWLIKYIQKKKSLVNGFKTNSKLGFY